MRTEPGDLRLTAGRILAFFSLVLSCSCSFGACTRPHRTAPRFFLLMAGSLPFEGVGGGIPDRMRTEPGALHLTVGCILALYSPVVVFVHLLIAVLTPGFHLAFVHVIYFSPAVCFLPLFNRLLVFSFVLSNLLFCCLAWSTLSAVCL